MAISHDPIEQLRRDREQARGGNDPCANLCTLANVDESGFAQARTLILREVDNRLAVFINATSPKWRALNHHPVSVVVWLPTQQVQYRMSCTAEEIPPGIVHDSWHLRPDPPKRMDWFYSHVQPQSSPIHSREMLLSELDALSLPDPLSAPETARGLYLLPAAIERLHLGQDNGVHDRRRYESAGAAWSMTTLVP